jgi:membrane protease YdiL (CAAX protease family)
MSDEPTTVSVALPLDGIAASKGYRWFEVSLVLLISFGSYILKSLYLLIYGRNILPPIQDSRWVFQIIQEISGILLLGYVLSRRRLRFRNLGLRWSFADLRDGIVVIVAAYMTYVAGYYLVYSIHYAIFASAPSGMNAREFFGHPSFMAIPLFLLNPFFEELIVRAYLMTEIKEMTGSWILSVTVSTAVQFSYHLYYGWLGAISLSFQFLVFSIYYARTQRATPIIIGHGFFDILGLVRLW